MMRTPVSDEVFETMFREWAAKFVHLQDDPPNLIALWHAATALLLEAVEDPAAYAGDLRKMVVLAALTECALREMGGAK